MTLADGNARCNGAQHRGHHPRREDALVRQQTVALADEGKVNRRLYDLYGEFLEFFVWAEDSIESVRGRLVPDPRLEPMPSSSRSRVGGFT